MTILTKAEIGRAVTAIRELSDIIERLEKSTWPLSSQNDVLRKADGLHPRASRSDDAATKALATLADAERRVARLEAAKDLDAQHAPRKTASR
jgi:hypothetical protein